MSRMPDNSASSLLRCCDYRALHLGRCVGPWNAGREHGLVVERLPAPIRMLRRGFAASSCTGSTGHAPAGCAILAGHLTEGAARPPRKCARMPHAGPERESATRARRSSSHEAPQRTPAECSHPPSFRTVSGHDQRRPRLLHPTWRGAGAVIRREPAREGLQITSQQLIENHQTLIESCDSLAAGHLVHSAHHLIGKAPGPDAVIDPAARELIERENSSSHVDRVAPRQIRHQRAETDLRRVLHPGTSCPICLVASHDEGERLQGATRSSQAEVPRDKLATGEVVRVPVAI